MATAENRLTEWLRDAQAMEKQAEAMLDALAEGIEHYPDVKAQIERHLQEAREQVSALQGYVEQFGEGAQTWKSRLDSVQLWGRVLAACSWVAVS